jgi:hypothetical protein
VTDEAAEHVPAHKDFRQRYFQRFRKPDAAPGDDAVSHSDENTDGVKE